MTLIEMYAFTRWNTKKCFVQSLLILILIAVWIIFFWPINIESVGPLKSLYVQKSYTSALPESVIFYNENCFDRLLIHSIDGFSKNTESWSKAYDRKCQVLWKKFQLIYRLEERQGRLSIPAPFRAAIYRWLGSDVKLMASMEKQNIYHILNHYSREYTVYNSLRSKRPMPTDGRNIKKFVNELSEKTKVECDFCRYKNMTAEDTFGRVFSKYSGSAANSFKLDKWHGLFLTKKHNPLELNEDDFLDWFDTALEWFRKANSIDKDARFPMMIWDSLPHAGASQFHPHMHGILGAYHYHGSMANQLVAARAYHADVGSDYWVDLVEIHAALGLAVRLGEAVAIAPLTAMKDYELLLLSKAPGRDLFRLLFYVIQTYHELDRFCYSSGMALPMLGVGSRDESLPALIRIGTRGQCDSSVSDVSSLELYLMYNVNVDPYNVIARLQDVVAREGQHSRKEG